MRMPTPSTCRSARPPGIAPPHDAPIEDYIKQLDAHGITHAVLAGASIYGDYNDYQIARYAQTQAPARHGDHQQSGD